MDEGVCYDVSWMSMLCGKEHGLQPCEMLFFLLLDKIDCSVDEVLEVPATFLLSVWFAPEC